jgi:hypothetical protein
MPSIHHPGHQRWARRLAARSRERVSPSVSASVGSAASFGVAGSGWPDFVLEGDDGAVGLGITINRDFLRANVLDGFGG